MMKRKSLKVALMVAVAALVVLTANVVFGAGKQKALPEYIGSQACLGCHTDKWQSWSGSGHANMLNPIKSDADLPADPSTAPADLRAELKKAQFAVARTRFVAQDPATGHYKFINVTFNETTGTYQAYKGGSDWSTGCAGCHTTNFDNSLPKGAKNSWSENGISCEACHGPGRDHVLGKGDTSKISSGLDADRCGVCHGGNDRMVGGNLMADGTKWPVGYRPGMKLSQVNGIQLTPVDPAKVPPDPSANHLRNYNMWAASAHGNSLAAVVNNKYATAECYTCHTAEGVYAKEQGKKLDISHKENLNTLTCVACHDPHGSANEYQLRQDPEKLCASCHANEAVAPGKPAKAGSSVYESNEAALQGYGAIGIKETPSFHSDITCQTCHMTEGNHLFQVIRPDAPDLAANRADTCTTCHKDSDKDVRAAYLQQWQATYTTKTAALDADVKLIADAVKANAKALTPELKAKYDAAVTNLSIIEHDGSKGAHNFEYAMKIMTQAAKDLAAAKAGLSK